MNHIPDALYADREMTTWLIVGASRGIGLEFVKQLLLREERIIATVRETHAAHASMLWGQAGGDHGRCQMFICDVLSEASIVNFVSQLAADPFLKIDYVVINAGVLRYPNRATELSFDEFAFHLHTNTIGPIITAQKLLQTNIPIGTIVFMSSDSGSAQNFLEREDGFAAYSASKAALNQMLRHMAAELKRKDDDTIILALHPGEVATDMSNINVPWQVEGIITPEQSVVAMIDVIQSKGIQHSGTFWTWQNQSKTKWIFLRSSLLSFHPYQRAILTYEADSLARELGGTMLDSNGGEACMRGAVDQEPLLLEVEQPRNTNAEKRFVLVPNDRRQDTPESDAVRRSRRASDKPTPPPIRTDLEETPVFTRREPSPYAYSKATKLDRNQSSSESFLSPDPIASSSARLSIPRDQLPETSRRTATPSAAQTNKEGKTSKWGSDSRTSDESDLDQSEHSSKYDDWYVLDGCPDFHVCPDCLDLIVGRTPYQRYFKRARRRSLGARTKCDFSSPWVRLAWLMTLKQQRQSLDLIYSIASIITSDLACPGDSQTSGLWYSLLDTYGDPIPDLYICARDRDSRIKYLCSLRAPSRTFAPYLNCLAEIDERALRKNQPPDLRRFAQLVRENAARHACPRDNLVLNQAFYIIPALPEFTVCEDCYEEVVYPALMAGSAVADQFAQEMRVLPGQQSCQLYSPRMRRVWQRAVEDADLIYLANKARERKRVEVELQAQHRALLELMGKRDSGVAYAGSYGGGGGGVGGEGRVSEELEKIRRLWKDWE
ncbi:hypothetical protein H2199_000194 [Coniosporium tulheliwenetii]|uniref:Uncharacterized protein n=1 Tax=Coniosporium tulheliwenetii TaxID=3383036 RepID=A0ACC2ZPT9_9PEZI|nr:hypothetical protein H2199_000194 [Cladosporium sp. JES 115]